MVHQVGYVHTWFRYMVWDLVYVHTLLLLDSRFAFGVAAPRRFVPVYYPTGTLRLASHLDALTCACPAFDI